MWRIVQQGEADDYVLATGEAHSVRELAEVAFAQVGREIVWSGSGVEEIGTDRRSGKVLIRIDPNYYRPTEVDLLLGDPSKARRLLGWRHTTTFRELVAEMVRADMALLALEESGGKAALQRHLRTLVFADPPVRT